MLNLISNIRVDRIKRNNNHSFKKIFKILRTRIKYLPEKNSLDTQISSWLDWFIQKTIKPWIYQGFIGGN